MGDCRCPYRSVHPLLKVVSLPVSTDSFTTDIYPDELPTDFHPQLRALVEKNNRDVAPPERDKCGGVIEQFEILIFDLDEDSDGGHVFGEVDDNSELGKHFHHLSCI
jgi:hypothetical protein